MIKTVIFDFDGILVDSEPVNVAAAVQTFRDFGYPLSDAHIKQLPGKSSKDFIPLFLRDFGLSQELFENLYQKNRENYLALWDTDVVKPMPFARGTVFALYATGIILSIATSNHKISVEKFLERFRLRAMVSHILTGEDVVMRKPNPEIYCAMKRRLGFLDSEILAVEDTEHGLVSAKGAGLFCAVIPTQFSRHHDFSRADYVLSSLRELPALVFRS